ncbi:MAG: DUF1338 domain-containing protein [Candidatus Omnitrophica bacterium]|nr:DUF1338 domain-containing protein [Candidatus Omnitrophota bacterium]
MYTLDQLLKKLWIDYSSINQQAHEIHQLLTERGEKVINDHIAFRTFNIPEIGIDALAQVFKKLGYQSKGEYHFKEKKLFARHFEHWDSLQPKIFISELKLEECSEDLEKTVYDLFAQVPKALIKKEEFCLSGRPWKPISLSAYEKLQQESEYAAWMAVFGFRANHFTVLFNALKSFQSLQEFNAFLKEKGFKLNVSGGEIKGSANEYLEQSSTIAHPVEMVFSDGEKVVPACYYEFARRYPLPSGGLFQGFVAQSAEKIFESTDNRPRG